MPGTRKLGRTADQRTAMLRAMVTYLLENGKIEIAVQNHSYAVCEDSVKGSSLEVTHSDILDGTIAGLKCEKERIFSVQYHPDSLPGDGDGCYLFDKFIDIMKEGQKDA